LAKGALMHADGLVLFASSQYLAGRKK